MRCASCSTVGW
ncbi:hypothetical protein D7Y55_16720 [Stenotrophomonas maltophilia]|nr:hypothetical protein [Stenotrophomonas maltophilia]